MPGPQKKTLLIWLPSLCLLCLVLWSYVMPGPRSASEIARGDVQLIAGRFPEAGAHYEEALRLAPQDFRPYQRLARVQQGLGRSAQAQELFQKALDLAPEDLQTQLLLAESYLKSGQGKAAKQLLRMTLASHPSCLEALLQTAWACELQGDFEASKQWYRKVLEVHPHYCEAEYHLGMAALRETRYQDALDHFQYTFGIAHGWDVRALEGSVTALTQLGRPDELEALIKKLEDRDGHPPLSLAAAHFNLGVMLAVHQDYERARRHLQKTVDYAKNGELAERATTLLGKLGQ